ncbi:MAG: hypothetical protein NC204_01105 [Candidatus Amulumruptor caecigallinarius]|nr:hypothetical protein [Candidatus Amulumruptor caecigallinarius]
MTLMKEIRIIAGAVMAASSAVCAAGTDGVVVATDAYRWQGDTIYQNEFKAWAESPEYLRSTYKGRPGYFMPISQEWRLKNNLDAYPRLSGGNMLHRAVYNMALDEMVNAVEPDTTLRTGKEWAGVWTRDVSYSIILSMAALQPEASMISLMKKVLPSGQIVQDTGSGGAWPISTDRMVWVLAAWEIYKVTGDRAWLEKVYPIAVKSLAKDEATVFSPDGLVKGETSFIDWREQSYPRWMQTADIARSEAMGTNVMYAAALKAVAEMAAVLGKKNEAANYAAKADSLAAAIDKTFYMPDKGYYGMYTYGRDNMILNPRAESLGESLAILFDIAPADRQKEISENTPVTPFGPPVFYPQIPDIPNYHNNALWPWVASYWTLAQAKAGNEAGVLQGIGSVFRPAALFCTNKENLNLDNGDIFTELNSSNMLWCLAGNIALTQQMLFGVHFEKDGLRIAPFVPKVFEAERTLSNFPYRGARLSITVNGYGDRVKSLTLNGKSLPIDKVIPARMLSKGGDIVVEMANEPIAPMKLNRVSNLKTPVTPAAWLEHSAELSGDGANLLRWNPIEYIGEYVVLKDGKEAGRTHQTEFPAVEPGEWQVMGVSGDGVPGFASEPRSNRLSFNVEFPGETDTAVSKEISYPARGNMEGFHGAGFVELDRESGPVTLTVDIAEGGDYSVAARYANGNGPVNTENKAAVRTLLVDGEKAGTVVMPQRGVGNWADWGMSNSTVVSLSPGRHELTIEYHPEDANMNPHTNHALIDHLTITKMTSR